VGMAFLEASLPRGGVDPEQPVKGTERAHCAEDGDETKQRPPAEAVNAEEQNCASGEKTDRCIIGANIGFHGELDCVQL
jgi:hypothetical protein